jgi:hypothetical protein
MELGKRSKEAAEGQIEVPKSGKIGGVFQKNENPEFLQTRLAYF